ncbi:DUF7937 domain-containing protein [Mycolicibacterium thermoresistibile]
MTDTVARRDHLVRDGVAAALVLLGLLLPWNVYVGLGIPGTPGWTFAVLLLVTLLSLAAVMVGRKPGSDRMRLLLNVPYFVVVVGFLLFTVVQAIRYGGTGSVPPGIGPGAWAGTAGALLAAQPVIRGDGDDPAARSRLVSSIAIISLVLGLAATAWNLYWRTRFVLPEVGAPDVGTANLATALTALLYALVAVVPVIVVYRWLRSRRPDAGLATVLLGTAVLAAGVLVWVLPVGRDLDAFHGIAQSTGTSGVGFEGYLAWVAAAAILAPGTASALRDPHRTLWRGAVRSCLVLVGAWCVGTAVLRLADVVLSAVLELPAPPYNGTALMAFDLLAAALAWWLFVNAGRIAPGRLLTTLFAVLCAALLSRIIVGVALVPRVQPLDPTEINDVFGNTLVQQVTSTFDVALVVVALGLLVIAVFAARPQRSAVARSSPAQPPAPSTAKPTIVVPQRPARIARPGRDGS